VVHLSGLDVLSTKVVGNDGKHLSLKLRDSAGKSLAVIGFGLAERYNALQLGDKVSVQGNLNKNEFQGRISVQMVLSELANE